MEDGLTAAYNDFTKFANEQLEKLAFNISTRKFKNLAISASHFTYPLMSSFLSRS